MDAKLVAKQCSSKDTLTHSKSRPTQCVVGKRQKHVRVHVNQKRQGLREDVETVPARHLAEKSDAFAGSPPTIEYIEHEEQQM